MLIYWSERKHLHERRVQLPQDFLGTPTWPPFHCFGKPTWPPWRHVKTLYPATMVTWLRTSLHRRCLHAGATPCQDSLCMIISFSITGPRKWYNPCFAGSKQQRRCYWIPSFNGPLVCGHFSSALWSLSFRKSCTFVAEIKERLEGM